MAVNREKLEKMYEKKLEQMQKHSDSMQKHKELMEKSRKEAEDYKKQIEALEGMKIHSMINQHNLSGEEYKKLMSLLVSHAAIEEALKSIVKQEGEKAINET